MPLGVNIFLIFFIILRRATPPRIIKKAVGRKENPTAELGPLPLTLPIGAKNAHAQEIYIGPANTDATINTRITNSNPNLNSLVVFISLSLAKTCDHVKIFFEYL